MTMNYKRMAQLKEIIKHSPSFTMEKIYSPCGAPACIAGHLMAMKGISYEMYADDDNIGAITTMINELGITKCEAMALFTGDFTEGRKVKDITPQQAIDALNDLEKKHRAKDANDKTISQIINNTPTPTPTKKEKEIA